MWEIKVLKNQRFGRLSVIEFAGLDKHRKATWKCVCDCGNEKIVSANSLTRRNRPTVSCNCRRWEAFTKMVDAKRLPLEERRRRSNARARRHRLSSPKQYLGSRMGNAIYAKLRGLKANQKWQSLVGYSTEELRDHMERNFKPGMNWSRMMRGEIHIDHIIPKSKFDYNAPSDIEFKRCWAIENLRPEWASKNMSRGNRIIEPAQIPLGV